MEAVLLGNGFDLHHKFPTMYINFLNVVKFIIENKDSNFRYVSEVLGDSNLHKNDLFIKECYETHKTIYNECEITSDIDIIKEKAQDNIWFEFLYNSVNKNIGWIDFETEIVKVIKAFTCFFDNAEFEMLSLGELTFDMNDISDDPSDIYTLQQFDYFFYSSTKYSEAYCCKDVKTEYSYECPVGSGIYEINKEKIISELYLSLRELADLLKSYLYCFVDNPLRKMSAMMYTPNCKSYPYPNKIFSFNYTRTFEMIYHYGQVYHIHGKNVGNIVLGINPDEKDELYDIDTSFLQFKKYFQRTFFKTDLDYLAYVESCERMPKTNRLELTVIGHSLDVTDEDIIRQLFEQSDKITVLYHNETAVKNQIKNLVKMYGKKQFDRLRLEKQLTFVPQADMTWSIRE